MPDGYEHTSLVALETNSDKPGRRWELSPLFDIPGANINIAILSEGDRLSQNHYHYHLEQEELFYVASGQCRAEVNDGQVELQEDDVMIFESGESGVHVLHNPYSEPCKLIAVGWPQEDRYPVEQVATLDEIVNRRSD